MNLVYMILSEISNLQYNTIFINIQNSIFGNKYVVKFI